MNSFHQRHLDDHGFVVINRALDVEGVLNVNRTVTSSLSGIFTAGWPKSGDTDEVKVWTKEKNKLAGTEQFRGLLDGMKDLLDKLCPQGWVLPKRPQICTRFPGEDMYGQNGWHIDNYDKPRKHLPPEFDYLIGVPLTGCIRNGVGNLLVFPGSEKKIQRFIEDKALEGIPFPDCLYNDCLSTLRETIDVGKGFQVKCAPGDLIVCKRMLAHSAVKNWSESPRTIVYFRLRSKIPTTESKDNEIDKEIERRGYGRAYTKGKYRFRWKNSKPNGFASMVTIYGNKVTSTDGFLSSTGHYFLSRHLRGKSILEVGEWIYENYDAYELIREWFPKSNNPGSVPVRVGLSFHLCAGRAKTTFLRKWAQELNLNLILIPGPPGKVVIVGYHDNVIVFKERFGCLHWK